MKIVVVRWERTTCDMRRRETKVNLNEEKKKRLDLKEELSQCQGIYLMLQRAEVRHVQELQVTISVQVNTERRDKRERQTAAPI